MPSVASLGELRRAAAAFTVADAGLVIKATALEAARRSLEASGLLLLGEVHGVRENPLIIRALMRALGLSGLALEWPAELARWSAQELVSSARLRLGRGRPRMAGCRISPGPWPTSATRC